MALSLHAYRSASASAARPFDERRAGRRISSSVRPSIRSAPNDTAAKPTNFTVGFHASSKSQSVVRSGAVKLLQFLRCSGFARKMSESKRSSP